MSKQVTWLGDEDPSVQVIEQFGHTFVKGEAIAFDGDTSKLEGNPFFSVGKKAGLRGSLAKAEADAAKEAAKDK